MSPETTRILVIENDPGDVADTLGRTASDLGTAFEATRATTLAAAVDHLQHPAFDVVLLDLSVQDSKGWAAFERVHGCASDLPFVLITPDEDERTGMDALEQGAQDYVLKGHTTPAQLRRAIRYAIERKKTETQLRRYHEHLEELVGERTAKFNITNEQLLKEIGERKLAEVRLRAAIKQLREHDDAQSQFVSNVSHDLRTPLASITYAIDNMLKGVIGPIPDKVRGYLDMIKEDCRRLLGTVNDILDMSRIDAHMLVLHKVKLPFARFTAKLTDSIRIQIDAQKQHLTTQLTSVQGFTECDAQKMERVVLNIIQNAIKYTPPGGHIRVALRSDEDNLMLDVIDDGIGIAPDDLEHVMERFYRVGEHITGTGLGLSLAKEIVELHGGSLSLISPPNGQERGTHVTIRLQKCTPPTVIIVDDEDGALGVLEQHLILQGYAVTCTRNATEALQRLNGSLDFLITDLTMPGMDGIELIETIRTMDDYHDLPVIAITGRNLSSSQRETLAGFGIAVLAKPWSGSELYARMEEAMAARKYLGG